MDFETQILVLICLQMLYESRYKHKIIFDIFFIYFLSIIYLFEKRKRAYSYLPSKDSLIIHFLYSKHGFTYRQFIQYKIFLVRLHVHIDLLKLKTYKLFEDSDADLSWLLF